MTDEKTHNLANDALLGHYRILQKIGAGGMGEVYLAEDTRLERKVVLKILSREFAEDRDRMSRFVLEAKSASALNHPNIITIHEINEYESTHFIAMEFIDGEMLRDRLQNNELAIEKVLDISLQIALALSVAHEAGITHRDIKPENIMIRRDGLVKVLDFGIAKISTPTKSNEDVATAIQAQTQAGMILGTPNYMSPEQARGLRVDHQTDIFSFGVVLYEMLSGSSPFKDETVSDVISAVLTKDPPRLSDIPIELEEILNKTLQKDKRNRYQTASDLLNDLKEVKQEWEIKSRLNRASSPKLQEPQTQILKTATTAEEKARSVIENLRAIAVLPFTNMSADEDNEYFCDGLAEELLNGLSKIDELKVAARTSAFSFKNSNANVRDIGEKLGVKTVLEGSVRKSGSKLRISVQLVNAADGFQFWSERYDREMIDIFEVQDEITRAIVSSLKLKLLESEEVLVLRKGTENTQAYESYLRGRYFWNKRTYADFMKAIQYFEKAISIDGGYALAYAGLADCYRFLGYYEALPPSAVISKAEESARKALELDETLPEIYTAIAGNHLMLNFNWRAAEQTVKKAIQIDPKLPAARYWYSIILSAQRRFEESSHQGQIALELDPLSPIAAGLVAHSLFYARRYDETIELCLKSLEISPNFYITYWVLGGAYRQTGELDKAIENLRTAASLNDIFAIKAHLGAALALDGQTDQAFSILRDFEKKAKNQYVSPLCSSIIYTALGDLENSLHWLEKAWDVRAIHLLWLAVEPLFDSLRAEPQFLEISRKVGLPE